MLDTKPIIHSIITDQIDKVDFLCSIIESLGTLFDNILFTNSL